MFRRAVWQLGGSLSLVLLVGLAACSDSQSSGAITEPGPEPQLSLDFIGSDACGYCHTFIFNEFRKSGHPYKLNPVVDGKPPIYPFSEVPAPPAGFTWDDVSYVIGGFGWKARFIGKDGFIITAGGKNQYNLATGEYVDYHKDQQKPYDCGGCHTTGYRADGHQDDMAGIVGQWAFPGVQCEECHGPGSLHQRNPTGVAMTIDTRTEACGRCHNRGGMNDQIPASGGFIRHHEQYNEMVAGGHKNLECNICHDPHTGVKYNDQEGAAAINVACEDCHTEARASLAQSSLSVMADLPCTSCHMPFAAKSAVKFDTYVGDIKSHLVTINVDPAAEQFSGGLANHYLTLDFACLGCHNDEDRTWAAQNATNVHGPNFSVNRSLAPTRPPHRWGRRG